MRIRAVLPAPTFCRGFTLTEMAVVLVIVALLIGGLILPIGTQQDIRYINETDASLKNIHEALLGFAAANGRLPCPAAPAGNGTESFAGGGNADNGECSNFYNGFVPAVTLGIQPTDAGGFAIDAWGHRIRYAVTDQAINGVARAVTRSDGMRSATMNSVAAATLVSVCTTSTGIAAGNCGGATSLVTNAPAVIFSTGKNEAGAGADEQANSTTLDAVFVSHVPAPPGAANGEFDDQVLWISPNILFNRMLSAGRLP